ncbi:acetyl-CoA carboxylase biotin carboxyl carrier protein [candidate division KSB1 bacterium]|nr:acetyl-CoA carboxylase biotin carboxyl carrier protein [candidate division KSB1 bacterium]
MNEKELQRLIELVEKSNIGELEISLWGRKVRISKTPAPGIQVNPPPAATPPQLPSVSNNRLPEAAPVVTPAESASEVPAKAPAIAPVTDHKQGAETFEIKSPMVGTFYRAPSPDSEPYIEVGDIISPGQPLCIIEAMKLMNEIESEINGRIVKILVENAKPVEYNQVLFQVEKA